VPSIEPFYIHLGRRLSGARSAAGLSQERLGARLSPPVTRASIANIEAGKQRVLAKTLVDLAAALEIEVINLLPPPPMKTAPPVDLNAELQERLGLAAGKVNALVKQLGPAKPKRGKK